MEVRQYISLLDTSIENLQKQIQEEVIRASLISYMIDETEVNNLKAEVEQLRKEAQQKKQQYDEARKEHPTFKPKTIFSLSTMTTTNPSTTTTTTNPSSDTSSPQSTTRPKISSDTVSNSVMASVSVKEDADAFLNSLVEKKVIGFKK